MTPLLSKVCPCFFPEQIEPARPLEEIEQSLLSQEASDAPVPDWDGFIDWAQRQQGTVNPFVLLFGNKLPAGDALDLGSGTGDNVKLLLGSRWSVTAVDANQKAIEVLKRIQSPKLNVIHSTLEEFQTDKKFSLILAFNVLGFCTADKIKEIWGRIYDALPKNGHVICSFPTLGRSAYSKWALNREEIQQFFIEKRFKIVEEIKLNDPFTAHPLVFVLKKI
ncbi:MAG: class I SAM-dependent methyltransferase [Verrucomicrobia bacterium]|nr:class I SAM-dependent methyltransferase [Verrucomicrobiota bacterium]